jgi:hypothetical protein
MARPPLLEETLRTAGRFAVTGGQEDLEGRAMGNLSKERAR